MQSRPRLKSKTFQKGELFFQDEPRSVKRSTLAFSNYVLSARGQLYLRSIKGNRHDKWSPSSRCLLLRLLLGIRAERPDPRARLYFPPINLAISRRIVSPRDDYGEIELDVLAPETHAGARARKGLRTGPDTENKIELSHRIHE